MPNNFENTYKGFLKSSKNFKKAMQSAYENYVEKYATEKGKKETKTKYFEPGNIYSFQYLTTAEPDKSRPFINARPVILSFGAIESAGTVYETGIDLMVVPYPLRVEILARIFKYFAKPIADNTSAQENGKKMAAKINLNYNVAKKILDGTGWQIAYGTFDKTKIKGDKMYDYSDWINVTTLDTKALRGVGLRTIYDMYIKRISNPPDPMKEVGKI